MLQFEEEGGWKVSFFAPRNKWTTPRRVARNFWKHFITMWIKFNKNHPQLLHINAEEEEKNRIKSFSLFQLKIEKKKKILTVPRSNTRLFWVHFTSVSGTEPSTSHDKVIWLSVTNCFGLWTILVDIGFTGKIVCIVFKYVCIIYTFCWCYLLLLLWLHNIPFRIKMDGYEKRGRIWKKDESWRMWIILGLCTVSISIWTFTFLLKNTSSNSSSSKEFMTLSLTLT